MAASPAEIALQAGVRHRRRAVLALGMAGTLAACTRLARARPPADLPGAWLDLEARLRGMLPPDQEETPALSLASSRLALAMFEAANAVRPRFASYLGIATAPAETNPQEAVHAAARFVLLAAYPGEAREIEDFYTLQSGGLPDGLAKLRGTVVGEHAGALVLARPAIEPGAMITPFRPQTNPGAYIAPALPDLPAFLPALKPWFLDRADALRPPPPPALSSPDFAASFNETSRLGGKASTARSTGQTEAAEFWAHYSWANAAHAAAFSQENLLATTTRAYALIAMAMLDARIAIADAKFAYNLWRPVTAIRNGDITGNAATPRIDDWQPLLPTQADPEYPSGSAAEAACLAAILASLPGHSPERRYRFDGAVKGASRSLTLAQYLEIVPASSIWSGAHFRFSVQAGQALGTTLATQAIHRFAPKRT